MAGQGPSRSSGCEGGECSRLHSHSLTEDWVHMEEIIIWESNVETIRACETAVHQALKELGLKARVTINSEPPLISRNQLWERLPVLELRDQRWSLHPGRAFTAEQLIRLFTKVFADQMEEGPGPNSAVNSTKPL